MTLAEFETVQLHLVQILDPTYTDFYTACPELINVYKLIIPAEAWLKFHQQNPTPSPTASPQDFRDYLLGLNWLALESVQSIGGNLPTPDQIKLWEKALDQAKQEASQRLAQLHSTTITSHDAIASLIRQQSSTLPAEELASLAIEQSPAVVANYIIASTPNTTETEAVIVAAPVAQVLFSEPDLSLEHYYVVNNFAADIATTNPQLPPATSNRLATQITVSALLHPYPSPDAIPPTNIFFHPFPPPPSSQPFLANAETQAGQSIILPSHLPAYALPATADHQLSLILETQAHRAGISTSIAKDIAKKFISFRAPILVSAVSDHTPVAPDDSPEKKEGKRRHVSNTFIQEVLSYFKPEQTQFFNQIQLDPVTQYIQKHSPRYYDRHPDESTSVFFKSVIDYSKQLAQDTLTNLALDALVVGPVGAWIMADLGKGLAEKGLLMDVITPAELAKLPLEIQAKILGTAPSGAISAAAGTTEAAAAAATTTRTIAGITFALTGDTLAITIGGTTITIPGVGWIIAGVTALIALANHIPILKDILKFLWDKVVKPTFKFIKNSLEALLGFSALGLLGFIGSGALIGGAFFGSPVLGGLVGFGAHSGLHILTSGGSRAAASHPIVQMSNFASRALIGLGTIATTEILVPMIITVISLPIIIALLLFIINNSALVVPPSDSALIGTSSGGTVIVPGPGGTYPYCWPVSSGTSVSGYWPNGGGHHVGISKNSIDLGTITGTPVYSTHDGTVVLAGWNNQGYGNLVKIQSPNGISSFYAHLSLVLTSVGSKLPAGTLVGYSGGTGNSTGPHLHYEIRPDTLEVGYYMPFGNSCERLKKRISPIKGCEASKVGGADKQPDSCHE